MRNQSSDASYQSLCAFAHRVKSDFDQLKIVNANPEDQLKKSVSDLVIQIAESLGKEVRVLTESPVDDIGRPDLVVVHKDSLIGYIELKAPGLGTTHREMTGANRKQFERFMRLPNIIYTDARDWTRYENGTIVSGDRVRLGPIDETGDKGLNEDDALNLKELFRPFLKWEPIVPTNPKALAELLAPITRMIRDDVSEAASVSDSALSAVYADWQRTLFPEASLEEFGDSYAQTVTYGLLLAKLDGAMIRDTAGAAKAIAQHSSLLSRTLEVLTQAGTRVELGPGLELLERTIDAVDPAAIHKSSIGDPWLYFYEDFLAVYDPRLRNERGVYYTPAQVVGAQVRLVDHLIKTRLGKPDGVADSEVTILDPATGTGTYLLQALQTGVETAIKNYGPGAAGSIATQMAKNLYGFELLVGPYAVAHLRLSQAIQGAQGRVPTTGVNIRLTNTLESPNDTGEIPHGYFERPLAEEHRRAQEVKRNQHILVCIGNPPYEREIRESEDLTRSRFGAWVRYGDAATTEQRPLLEDFLLPARESGVGGMLQPIYNLYVYFWRWAIWKVFETQNGPGVLSFITASSYLRGPGFAGMREVLRRTLDELWIIDLEGGSLGARKTENVFDIRTPVAIAIGIRHNAPKPKEVAKVHYTKVVGSRSQKFSQLDAINSFSDLEWLQAMEDWQKPLIPEAEGDYFAWPCLNQLMPWNHVGSNIHRRWPVGESKELLEKRWSAFVASNDRAAAFHETRDRKVHRQYEDQLNDQGLLKALSEVGVNDPVPSIVPYGFRSFDIQWAIRDTRVADFYRPPLWKILSEKQIYITSPASLSLGVGPAATITAYVPDLHHFRGSYGGRDVIPLYRGKDSSSPNITSGLLVILSNVFETQVTAEDLIAYLACVLSHSAYSEKFQDELEEPGARVPVTRSRDLFQEAIELGRQAIAWHTKAERFPNAIDTARGSVPTGRARITIPISDEVDRYPKDLSEVRFDATLRELHVGTGVISGVDPKVWEYEVSGMKIVRSWLGFRMKNRSGRSSSPLDDIRPERWTWEMTKLLLELLHTLEGVIALEPAQAKLLDEIVAGDLFLASELPQPTEAERRAPTFASGFQPDLGLDDGED